MSTNYARHLLKISVAQIIQTIGFQSAQSITLDVLTEVLERYIQLLCRTTREFAEISNRTEPTIDDLAVVFDKNKITISELEEFVSYVDVTLNFNDLIKFPNEKEQKLDFCDDPTNKELIDRIEDEDKEHIYYYFPLMERKIEEVPQETAAASSKPSENETGELANNVEQSSSSTIIKNGIKYENNTWKAQYDPKKLANIQQRTPVEAKAAQAKFPPFYHKPRSKLLKKQQIELTKSLNEHEADERGEIQIDGEVVKKEKIDQMLDAVLTKYSSSQVNIPRRSTSPTERIGPIMTEKVSTTAVNRVERLNFNEFVSPIKVTNDDESNKSPPSPVAPPPPPTIQPIKISNLTPIVTSTTSSTTATTTTPTIATTTTTPSALAPSTDDDSGGAPSQLKLKISKSKISTKSPKKKEKEKGKEKEKVKEKHKEKEKEKDEEKDKNIKLKIVIGKNKLGQSSGDKPATITAQPIAKPLVIEPIKIETSTKEVRKEKQSPPAPPIQQQQPKPPAPVQPKLTTPSPPVPQLLIKKPPPPNPPETDDDNANLSFDFEDTDKDLSDQQASSIDKEPLIWKPTCTTSSKSRLNSDSVDSVSSPHILSTFSTNIDKLINNDANNKISLSGASSEEKYVPIKELSPNKVENKICVDNDENDEVDKPLDLSKSSSKQASNSVFPFSNNQSISTSNNNTVTPQLQQQQSSSDVMKKDKDKHHKKHKKEKSKKHKKEKHKDKDKERDKEKEKEKDKEEGKKEKVKEKDKEREKDKEKEKHKEKKKHKGSESENNVKIDAITKDKPTPTTVIPPSTPTPQPSSTSQPKISPNVAQKVNESMNVSTASSSVVTPPVPKLKLKLGANPAVKPLNVSSKQPTEEKKVEKSEPKLLIKPLQKSLTETPKIEQQNKPNTGSTSKLSLKIKLKPDKEAATATAINMSSMNEKQSNITATEHDNNNKMMVSDTEHSTIDNDAGLDTTAETLDTTNTVDVVNVDDDDDNSMNIELLKQELLLTQMSTSSVATAGASSSKSGAHKHKLHHDKDAEKEKNKEKHKHKKAKHSKEEKPSSSDKHRHHSHHQSHHHQQQHQQQQQQQQQQQLQHQQQQQQQQLHLQHQLSALEQFAAVMHHLSSTYQQPLLPQRTLTSDIDDTINAVSMASADDDMQIKRETIEDSFQNISAHSSIERKKEKKKEKKDSVSPTDKSLLKSAPKPSKPKEKQHKPPQPSSSSTSSNFQVQSTSSTTMDTSSTSVSPSTSSALISTPNVPIHSSTKLIPASPPKLNDSTPLSNIIDTLGSSQRTMTISVTTEIYDEADKVWICPFCKKCDNGTPMIGCDSCDDWYHWSCVGINQEPPENEHWYCYKCGTNDSAKKKKKKKK